MSLPLSAYQRYLSIPTISDQPEHLSDMAAAREFLTSYFSSLGLSTQILPSQIHPAVFASTPTHPEKPTFLLYSHYDVEPVHTPSAWNTAPFTPVIKNNRVYARGANDNKGPFFAQITAVSQLITKYGLRNLPVNIKFIVDGEEEINCPGFSQILSTYSDLLACDYCICTDTDMSQPNHPVIHTRLRGDLLMDVTLQTAKNDLHSGSFGGVAPNPAYILSKILSRMKNHDHKITIPGFYSQIVPLTAEERRDFNHDAQSQDELKKSGKFFFISGGSRKSTLNERRWATPIVEVVGFSSGDASNGMKCVIPDTASVKLDIRTVPNQNPDQLYSLLIKFFTSQAPQKAVMRFFRYPAANPFMSDTKNPIFKLAKQALETAYGHPTVFQGEGASVGPVPLIAQALNVPVVCMAITCEDERAHGPNEYYSLDNLHKGSEALYHLFTSLTTKAL